MKTIDSTRFGSDWFPLSDVTGVALRSRRKYFESQARTERLFNSPLYSMRRLLNLDGVEEEEL